MKKLLLTGVAFTALFAGPATAADQAAPVYRRPVAVAAVPYSWTGFYFGGNVGLGASRKDLTSTSAGTGTSAIAVLTPITAFIANANAAAVPASFNTRASGFLGGAQIGYNWQMAGPWVVGVEADFQGTDIRGSDNRQGAATAFVLPNLIPGLPLFPLSTSSQATAQQKLDWLGTVRARLGFTTWDNRMLVYATGGLAYGKVEASESYSLQGCFIIACAPNAALAGLGLIAGPTGATGSASTTRVGWTAGAGMEWMINPQWSVKTEYLHYDLGTETFALSPSTFTILPVIPALNLRAIVNTTSSVRTEGDIIRIGVNYKFGNYATAGVYK